MKATRRTFLKNCAAAGIVGTVGVSGRAEASVGDVFPGWKPGEMDLHFIYTGSGENMFYRLPGGEKYRIYLLDARDESMKILARLDREVV